MVVINEILANPEGVDAGKEWIEVWNNSDKKAEISAFYIRNKQKIKKVSIKKQDINPQEIIVIPLKQLPNSETEISINKVEWIKYPRSPSAQSWQQTHICQNNDCDYQYRWGRPNPGKQSEKIMINEHAKLSYSEKIPFSKHYFEIIKKNAVMSVHTQGDQITNISLVERSPPEVMQSTSNEFLSYGIILISIMLALILQMNWEIMTRAAVSVRKIRFPSFTIKKPANSAAITSS